MSDVAKIQGHYIEVTVIGCTRLKNVEWFTQQDPCVCLDYAGNKYKTRTCRDGGINPSFNEKFVITLIEGLRVLNVSVWNSHSFRHDDFIASAQIQLQKVLSEGYDDTSWPLQTRTGRSSGEIRLLMFYPNAKKASAQEKPQMAPTFPCGYPAYPQFPLLARHQYLPNKQCHDCHYGPVNEYPMYQPPYQPNYPPHQPNYPPHQPNYPPYQPNYPPHQPNYPPYQPNYPAHYPQQPPPCTCHTKGCFYHPNY